MNEEIHLSTALSSSLKKDVVETVGTLAEVGLDSIMEDGLLKDIPFLSTAISIYHIGRSISERHNIKKLIAFLRSIDEQTVDEAAREQYIKILSEDPEKRSRELEYVLIIIDRYINYEKPAILAKLYVSYLKGNLNWEEFVAFSEMTDRFIVGDYEKLMSDSMQFTTTYNCYDESIIRLAALGLIVETSHPTGFVNTPNGMGINAKSIQMVRRGEQTYKRTKMGEKYVQIMRHT